MTHIAPEDESGYTLKMQLLANGQYTGEVFNTETLNKLPSLKLRDDDILFTSYSKSGCHWIWQNMRLMLKGEVILDSVDKESSMLEFLDFSTIDNLPSPRILNTHAFFETLPRDLLKGHVKVIHVYRNPKDIAVSFYHHHKRLKYYSYQGNFSDYIKRFAKGLVSNNSVFDYWQGWEEGLTANPQISCHFVSFENFKQNPISERRRLAEFLGLNCSDEFLERIKEATDIGVMKNLKGKVTDEMGQPIFYRKGVIGDWKNHFTVQESEWFDDIINSRMANSKLYKFIYSDDTNS